MKTQDGFTLVELVIVVAIIGIILTMVTLNFRQMNEKSRVESNTKEIHSVLMRARNDANSTNATIGVALAEHLVTSGTFTGSYPEFSICCGLTPPVPPPTVSALCAETISFDRRGLANVSNQTISLRGYSADVNPAMDCIVVSATRINMGKMNTGGTSCVQR